LRTAKDIKIHDEWMEHYVDMDGRDQFWYGEVVHIYSNYNPGDYWAPVPQDENPENDRMEFFSGINGPLYIIFIRQASGHITIRNFYQDDVVEDRCNGKKAEVSS
jgi:hypothetical protein